MTNAALNQRGVFASAGRLLEAAANAHHIFV